MGPAAFYFGSAVILTILAVEWLDSRLLWDAHESGNPASPTEARIKTKRRISPFWLLPVIALMIAGWLIWTSYEDRGSTITIDFQSADGIVAGRTPVRFRGGSRYRPDISLGKGLNKIQVRASIKSDMRTRCAAKHSSGWSRQRPLWPGCPVWMRWLAGTISA